MADGSFLFAFAAKLDPHFPQYAQRPGVPPSKCPSADWSGPAKYIPIALLRKFFDDKELCGAEEK